MSLTSAPNRVRPQRDQLQAGGEDGEAAPLLAEWREALADELENSRAALPVARADMRLDYYGVDHTIPYLLEMLEANLVLLEGEIGEVLPWRDSVWGKGG